MRPRISLRIALALALSGARVATAEPPAAPSPTDVLVTIESDDPRVRLESVGEGAAPSAICAPPCALRLKRDALYRISGDGVRATSPLRLPGDRSSATLSVRAGSSLRHRAGLGAAIAGAVVAVVSLQYFVASSSAVQDSAAGDSQAAHDRALETGFLLLLSGGALAFVGAYLLTSSQTRIDVFEP
jgi:hypothetical protein